MEKGSVSNGNIPPSYCKKCQRTLQGHAKQTCKDCRNRFAVASNNCTEKPTKDDLAKDIKNLPFTRIGEKYKVTDNTVRKWAKKFGLPYRRGTRIAFIRGEI